MSYTRFTLAVLLLFPLAGAASNGNLVPTPTFPDGWEKVERKSMKS